MNPRVAAMESEAVRWIRYCAVNDVNWQAALGSLTDEELGYCLRWEKRVSGMAKLKGEANRRGLGDLLLNALADRMDGGAKSIGAGFSDPPGPTQAEETFSEPYVGGSGNGKVFLTMKSSRAGRKCIGRSFANADEAMARAKELMNSDIIDIEPVKGDEMKSGQSPEVKAVEEVYQLGRREADQAKALLESERLDCEAIGKIKAAKFGIKANELLMYVTLYQIKQAKDYKKGGRTWEEFCRDIGEAQRSVDRILDELQPILQKISATQAEILGMPLNKIRYLGKSISANQAEITDDNAIVIADQRIEIIPENKDDLEAAIDLLKETAEKERQAHAKEVERLKKRTDSAVAEETKSLTAERDALVKEITRLKVFDPEGKDISWSGDQMKQIQKACSEFTILVSKFIMDDRLDDGQVEIIAETEKWMSIARRSLDDLWQRWDERFNSNFGD